MLYRGLDVADEFDLETSMAAFDTWLAGKDAEPIVNGSVQPVINEGFLAATRGWQDGSPYRAMMMLLSTYIELRERGLLELTSAERQILGQLTMIARMFHRAEQAVTAHLSEMF